MNTYTVVDSPLGDLTLVARDRVLAGLYFAEHARRPEATTFGERVRDGFESVEEQLAEYFAGARQQFELPLAPRGSTFQMQVWELLRAIPYGETRTYGQLAKELGNPMLAREVGAANARNAISIIVPCHRVVGAGGKLVGYAGGLERKRFLLGLESPVPQGEFALGGERVTARA
jgi:methylated-DNA-[protein]-cysteine S-methyltransferase